MAEAIKLRLKLLVDKKANRVLFAEAEKDFVDFLFNLLSLPVGTVIRLLTNSSMVGCIGNLYESFQGLNETYMQPNQNKDVLLKPDMACPVTNVHLVLPDTNPQQPKHTQTLMYMCPNYGCCGVTDNYGTNCSQCSRQMTKEVQFVSKSNSCANISNPTSEGGYVKGPVTYMVTDDLSVSPMSMISGVALLNKFNVKDFGALEEQVVEFGVNEGVELLKASLNSKTVLTNVFLVKKEVKVDGELNGN